MLLVRQEHALGCGVACVAARCGISYMRALKLFSRPDDASTKGYFCPDLIEALEQAGFKYEFAPFDPKKHRTHLRREGTIVYVDASDGYPAGHYLIRSAKGWMNSWVNAPLMIPVEAAVQRHLPGEVTYIIYENEI